MCVSEQSDFGVKRSITITENSISTEIGVISVSSGIYELKNDVTLYSPLWIVTGQGVTIVFNGNTLSRNVPEMAELREIVEPRMEAPKIAVNRNTFWGSRNNRIIIEKR